MNPTRRTARHEAGHAVGMAITSRRLPELTRCDRPEETVLGSTTFPWPEGGVTQDMIPGFIVAVLLGPMAVDEPAWPPAWPPDRDVPGDERQLAAGVSLAGYGEKEWDALVAEAKRVAAWPEFRRLVDVIGRALELNDTLDAAEIAGLFGPERLRKYGVIDYETETTK